MNNSSVIVPLDKDLVHKICSGQVVVTLASAVKELLENSLDAKATKIGLSINFFRNATEIKLKNYGSESIEVIDNGVGIKECDFEGITGKYCTSKLRSFEDLSDVETYGFRGEALSSLCSLANITLHTCSSDSTMGTRLEFDPSGQIKARRPLARPRGTTICVEQLFHSLPVRRRHLTDPNRLSKEYSKTINLLTAYCLVTVGTQISCFRSGKKGEKVPVLSNGLSTSYKDNIVALFGPSQFDALVQLAEVDLIPEDILEEFNVTNLKDVPTIRLEGFISKPPLNQSDQLLSPSPTGSKMRSQTSRSSSDRQFVYINGRPCDLPKIEHLATDLWRRCTKEANLASMNSPGLQIPGRSITSQFPMLMFMYELPSATVDINLTPDKRTLLLHHERYILALTKAILTKTLIDVAGLDLHSLSKSRINLSQSVIPYDVLSISMDESEAPSTPVQSSASRKRQSTFPILCSPKKNNCYEFIDITPSTTSTESPNQGLFEQESVDKNEDGTSPCFIPCSDELIKDHEIDTSHLAKQTVHFSTNNLRHHWSTINHSPKLVQKLFGGFINDFVQSTTTECCSTSNVDDGDDDDEQLSIGQFNLMQTDEAEKELTLYFSKQTFADLEVLGQFNLGFIIARHNDDLFIIDQHASDEKFRFEQLCESYRFTCQPLVVPQPLNLSVGQEQILINNLDVFAKNGFAFRIDDEAAAGQQVHLVATPMLEDKVFSKQDIEEMLFVLSESCSKRCRPSRLRDILASRACRSAVMIGMALNHDKMKRILFNMGTMNHPWNCPHGRPTMRHLFHLGILSSD